METDSLHVPVMLAEAIQALRASEGGSFVDCTLGMGGHSRGILAASLSATVLGVDRDGEALDIARRNLSAFGGRVSTVHADFKDLPAWTVSLPAPPVGILVDLGMSTYQLRAGRGFSFRDEGPLDMRMDRSRGAPALEFLATASEEEMARVFREYGEEPYARPIARALARRRAEDAPVATGRELSSLIEGMVPFHRRRGQVHPATRVFQALRIHVNGELEGLDTFLRDASDLLAPGGRLVVLAYHSLEDRTVKLTLRDLSRGCVCPPRMPVCGCGRKPVLRLLARRATKPSAAEVAANPAARSARLRAAVKV
jgi:16S rRNA (cytosine1402-N4)-methyltransferase